MSVTEGGDLEKFAASALQSAASFEQLSAWEHRMCWDAYGNTGSSQLARLRSGIGLSTTRMRWDHPWTFQLHSSSAPLKFNFARGAAPRMTPTDAQGYVLQGCQVHVRPMEKAFTTRCEFAEGGARHEHLALEIAPERLRELLGTDTLPRVLESMLADEGCPTVHEQAVTPTMSRLFDELVYCDARGPSRQLRLEAKGLELLAILVDELELASSAMSPLRPSDLERLERARRLLLEHMAAPPGLRDLARHVGLNEVKLKVGFRTLFGTSVFAYLRSQRLEAARRLLLERRLNVTEVAVEVGYQNPSKFAAAFRKEFGLPPSAVR